jgi:hypothetical protein
VRIRIITEDDAERAGGQTLVGDASPLNNMARALENAFGEDVYQREWLTSLVCETSRV